MEVIKQASDDDKEITRSVTTKSVIGKNGKEMDHLRAGG